MAVGYRDVYIVLRARDEASRIVRSVGRNMGAMGKQMEQVNQMVGGAQVKMARQAEVATRQFEARSTASAQTMARNTTRIAQQSAQATQRINVDAANKMASATAAANKQMAQIQGGYTTQYNRATAAIRGNNLAIRENEDQIRSLTRQIKGAEGANKILLDQQRHNYREANIALRRNNTDLAANMRTWQTVEKGKLEAVRQRVAAENAAIQTAARLRTDAVEAATRRAAGAEEAAHAARMSRNDYEQRRFQAGQRAQQEAIQNAERYLGGLAEKQQQFTQRTITTGMAVMGVGMVLTGLGMKGISTFNSMADAAIEFDRQARQTFTQLDRRSGSL